MKGQGWFIYSIYVIFTGIRKGVVENFEVQRKGQKQMHVFIWPT